MKTNVTMESVSDRILFGVVIRQETKDCSLCLTDLQEAYTHARIKNGWSGRLEVQHIINQKENSERIFYILSEQKIINWQIHQFMKEVEDKGMVKVLKELGVYKTTGRGADKRVMCNPYIWALIAMELNPMLYAKIVMWLTDQLILNRIEAGNFYKTLSAALYKLPSPDYKTVATELNLKIFGKHEPKIRNKGSQKQLSQLSHLEDNIAYCIENGFYKTNEEVISAIKNAKIA